MAKAKVTGERLYWMLRGGEEWVNKRALMDRLIREQKEKRKKKRKKREEPPFKWNWG